MFKIYNRKHKQVDILESPQSPVIIDVLNGLGELSFTIPSAYSQIELEGYIRVEDGHEYVVKEILLQGKEKEVKCIMNIEELLGMVHTSFFASNATLDTILGMILKNTNWTYTNTTGKDYTRNLYGINRSAYDMLQLMSTMFDVEFYFDTIGKVVHIVNKIGADSGTYFMSDLNLRQFNYDSHTHNLVTRVIPVGKDGLTIESVNGGKAYLENHAYSTKVIYGVWNANNYDDPAKLKEDAQRYLQEVSLPYESYEIIVSDISKFSRDSSFKYDVGDVITIIDADTNTRVKQRVVQRTYDLQNPMNDTLGVANKDRTFQDYYKRLQTIADMTDVVINADGTINNHSVQGLITEISVMKGQIDLKVEQTDIENALSDVDRKITVAKSEIKMTTDSITAEVSKKVNSSELGTKIQQSAKDIQIGFNGINNRININERSMDFTATNGNRDLMLYGGQVCIYNNTNDTFMGTVGNVLRKDTSYKGTGFLLGSNCNVFTIARDSSWYDITTNRSPNPQGIFYICFENMNDGAKGIHMRTPLYVTNNIEGYNGSKPKIHSFSSIESEVSCFDSWNTRSANSTIMRYDSSNNRINLGRRLNGNGYSGTGFSALEAPKLYFDNLYALNGNYGKLLLRTDGWNIYNGVNWDWQGYNILSPKIIGALYGLSVHNDTEVKEVKSSGSIIDQIEIISPMKEDSSPMLDVTNISNKENILVDDDNVDLGRLVLELISEVKQLKAEVAMLKSK